MFWWGGLKVIWEIQTGSQENLRHSGKLHRKDDFPTGYWKMNRSWQVSDTLDRTFQNSKRGPRRTWVTQGPVSEWVWLVSRMQWRWVTRAEVKCSWAVCWGTDVGEGTRERKRVSFWMYWVWCAWRTFERACGAGAQEQGWEYRVKNISLKVVIKQRAWLGSCRECVQTEMRMSQEWPEGTNPTPGNTDLSGAGRETGLGKKMEKPHQRIITRKWYPEIKGWESQMMQRSQITYGLKATCQSWPCMSHVSGAQEASLQWVQEEMESEERQIITMRDKSFKKKKVL